MAALPGHRPAHDAGDGRGRGRDGELPAARGRDRRRVSRRDRHASSRRWPSGFAPTWVLVSAGYDAHRADPLTGLGLAAGDYADLTARIMALAAPRRLVVFLEGGYDLDALRDSMAATVSTLLGEPERAEPATAGGPGQHRRPRRPRSPRRRAPRTGLKRRNPRIRRISRPARLQRPAAACRSTTGRPRSEPRNERSRPCWIWISCCARPWSAARRTSTSRWVRRRSFASTAASSGPISPTVSPVETERIAFAIMPKQRAEEFIGSVRGRLRVLGVGPRAVPRERHAPARFGRPRACGACRANPVVRGARAAAGHPQAHRAPARSRCSSPVRPVRARRRRSAR